MPDLALALWAFLQHVASRVTLLEAYEVASAAILFVLLTVLAISARRRPALGLHLDAASPPRPAGAGALAVKLDAWRRRHHAAGAGRA